MWGHATTREVLEAVEEPESPADGFWFLSSFYSSGV